MFVFRIPVQPVESIPTSDWTECQVFSVCFPIAAIAMILCALDATSLKLNFDLISQLRYWFIHGWIWWLRPSLAKGSQGHGHSVPGTEISVKSKSTCMAYTIWWLAFYMLLRSPKDWNIHSWEWVPNWSCPHQLRRIMQAWCLICCLSCFTCFFLL